LRERVPAIYNWFGVDVDPAGDELYQAGLRSDPIVDARNAFVSHVESMIDEYELDVSVDDLVESAHAERDDTSWVDTYRRPDTRGPPNELGDMIRSDAPELAYYS